MNCTLLTKEELIRGERIFRQLERVREENSKVELVDLVSLLLCIKWGITTDWNNSNWIMKVEFILLFFPIVHVLLNTFYIINC